MSPLSLIINEGIIMKKIISLLLGSIVAFTLSISAAFSAANEVRVAFFLEWATPNQEAKVKKVLTMLWEFQLSGQILQQVER